MKKELLLATLVGVCLGLVACNGHTEVNEPSLIEKSNAPFMQEMDMLNQSIESINAQYFKVSCSEKIKGVTTTLMTDIKPKVWVDNGYNLQKGISDADGMGMIEGLAYSTGIAWGLVELGLIAAGSSPVGWLIIGGAVIYAVYKSDAEVNHHVYFVPLTDPWPPVDPSTITIVPTQLYYDIKDDFDSKGYSHPYWHGIDIFSTISNEEWKNLHIPALDKFSKTIGVNLGAVHNELCLSVLQEHTPEELAKTSPKQLSEYIGKAMSYCSSEQLAKEYQSCMEIIQKGMDNKGEEPKWLNSAKDMVEQCTTKMIGLPISEKYKYINEIVETVNDTKADSEDMEMAKFAINAYLSVFCYSYNFWKTSIPEPTSKTFLMYKDNKNWCLTDVNQENEKFVSTSLDEMCGLVGDVVMYGPWINRMYFHGCYNNMDSKLWNHLIESDQQEIYLDAQQFKLNNRVAELPAGRYSVSVYADNESVCVYYVDK